MLMLVESNGILLHYAYQNDGIVSMGVSKDFVSTLHTIQYCVNLHVDLAEELKKNLHDCQPYSKRIHSSSTHHLVDTIVLNQQYPLVLVAQTAYHLFVYLLLADGHLLR